MFSFLGEYNLTKRLLYEVTTPSQNRRNTRNNKLFYLFKVINAKMQVIKQNI